MLRTTISKIRKVCTIAFVPRILRGNLRYSPSIYGAFGKFEKLTSVVKSVRKSTKATGDDEPPQSPEKRLKDEVSVVSLSKSFDLTSDHGLDHVIEHDVARPDIPGNFAGDSPLKSTPVSHYDECNKIISEIFGDANVTPQEELLMMSPVTISDNITGKLIKDRTSQLVVFGKHDSRSFKTTSHVNIERTTDIDKFRKEEDNFQSVLCYDAVLIKDKGGKTPEQVKSKPAQLKQESINTCLYDVDPEEYTSQWTVNTKALTFASKEKSGEEEIDAYWTDVYETAIENKSACHESNQAIDLDTLRVYRSLKGDEINSKETLLESRRITHTPEEIDRILRGSPYDGDDIYSAVANATTDKQHEEKLTQKIENIGETPLVEAEKPKVDGFNITPKVLGAMNKSPTITNESSLDEVAHRCLNLLETQVDKMLLKEIKTISNPVIEIKTSDYIKKDNTQHTNILHISDIHEEKITENTNVENTRTYNLIPNNLTGLGDIKLNSASLETEGEFWDKLTNTNNFKDSTEVDKDAADSETPDICSENLEKANFIANDYKQLKYTGSARDDKANKSLLNKNDEIKTGSVHIYEQSNPNLAADISTKEHLDPRHILTCNETCPISPKSIIDVNDVKNLEGTEAMYERSALSDYTQATKKDIRDDSKFDDGVGSSGMGIISRAIYKYNKENAKQTKLLHDYANTIKTANSEMIAGNPMAREDPALEFTKTSVTKAESESHPQMEIDKQMPLVVPINYKEIATKFSESTKETDPGSILIGPRASTTKPVENVLIEAAERCTDHSMRRPRSPSELHIHNKPSTVCQNLSDNSSNIKDSSNTFVESIHAASDKLQSTTQQLQATSEQLQATSEQLQETSKQLHTTSEKLDHCNVLYTYSDEKSSKKPEGSNPTVSVCPTVDLPVNTIVPSVDLIKPTAKSNATSPNETSEVPTETANIKEKYAELDQAPNVCDLKTITLKVNEAELTQEVTKADGAKVIESSNLDATLNSTSPDHEGDTGNPRQDTLPAIKDNLKLSELMKIVKERNQQHCWQELLTKPTEAKKSIPPLSRPRHKLPVFRVPGSTKLSPKPAHKICLPSLPRRRGGGSKKTNCIQCDFKALGIDHTAAPQLNRNETSNNNSMHQEGVQEIALTNDALPFANLTEDIILQLQNMGYVLDSAYKQGIFSLEMAMLAKTRFQFRSKNYKPWTPIPSWPLPKTHKRPKVQCPKDGCPIPPPRSVHDPHCGLKPCSTFPTYPKRTFSVLDYCTISLGEPTVVDIGEF